jgi:hypothetical protein
MIRKISPENRIRLLIVLISLAFFLPFNGLVHLFDWDEINFAESAREMLVTGDSGTVSINFIPFWEKPPLYIWMQVLSMKVFGISEFAARFPNVICGMLSLLVLFEIGRNLKDNRFGMIWAVSFGASVLPFLYFKSGIIDPWFNLFIFASLHFAFRYLSGQDTHFKRRWNLIVSAVILGLAVLTKGPAAILLFGLTVILFVGFERKFRLIRITDVLIFGLVLLVTGGAYHIYQLLAGNGQLVYDFFIYQIRLMKTEDAGHGGSIFYHPIVLFVGVFPASVFALQTILQKNDEKDSYRRLMIILFSVVLVIFSLIKTKIVHYSSMCYLPLSYLAALTVYGISFKNQQLTKLSKVLLITIGIIYAISPGLLQLVATAFSPEFLATFINDDFAIDCISTPVNWLGFEFLIGLAFAGVLITSVYFLKGQKQLLGLFAGTATYIFVFMFVLVPKIEQYTQGPAIEMYSQFRNQSVWITSLDYKSYAPLFYSVKKQRATADADEENFLLNGQIDRDVYFVAKTTLLSSVLEQYPQLQVIRKKGGFVLLKRPKS